MKLRTYLIVACLTLSGGALRADSPISFEAEVTPNPDDPSRLVLQVSMEIEEGWHLYSEVPADSPFQATELKLELPESIRAEGEVIAAPGTPYAKNPELMVVDGVAVISQELKSTASGASEIGVTVSYQLCDAEKCMQPMEWKSKVVVPAGKADSGDKGAFEFKNAHFEAPVRLMAHGQPVTMSLPSPALFDIDGDGRDELVVGGLMGVIETYPNKNPDPQGVPEWGRSSRLKTATGETITVNNWCCVGMTPQQVDLNGDRHQDLIVGCFEGVVYLIEGSAGGFRAPVRIKDSEGINLIISEYHDTEKNQWTSSNRPGGIGHCTSVAAVDWDADGDLDLVLGDKKGGLLYLRLNEGTPTEPRFAPTNREIVAGGDPARCISGVANPRIADWDGDGAFDILCGGIRGGVYFFRNTGTPGKPEFAAGECLVESMVKHIYNDRIPAVDGEPTMPGSFYNIETCDYDRDGDLDLLVGGYCNWANPAWKPLTEEEQRALDRKTEQLGRMEKEMASRIPGNDPDARKKFLKTEEGRKLVAELSLLSQEIRNASPKDSLSGNFVWLYRRK